MNFNLNASMTTAWRSMQSVLDHMLDSKLPEAKPLPGLPDTVEKARQEWLAAQSYYNSVTDSDLIDHAVYLMQAAEKKYIYLLKQARRKGVTYSPYFPDKIKIEEK
jgi:hypothetical protein